MPLTQRAVFWGAVGFAALMVVFFVMGALGWPGEPDKCTLPGGNCYCEAYPTPPATALVKQPVNTWSGLFPVIAGLVILALADRERRSPSAPVNPMTTGGFYAIAFGAVVLFLGPGAMFFHGGLTRLGGWLDNLSMTLFISFLILYELARIWRWDDNLTAFVAAYAGVNIAAGLVTWLVEGSGTFIFAGLVLLAIALEVYILLARPGGVERRFGPWMLLALVTFGLATVVWRLSWTGAPLCDPTSVLQGHGVWHMLAMPVTPAFIFGYLRTETRRGTTA